MTVTRQENVHRGARTGIGSDGRHWRCGSQLEVELQYDQVEYRFWVAGDHDERQVHTAGYAGSYHSPPSNGFYNLGVLVNAAKLLHLEFSADYDALGLRFYLRNGETVPWT